jgi:hypothetical protein
LIILFVALGFAVQFVDGTSGGHLGLFSGFLDRREWRRRTFSTITSTRWARG